MSSSAWKSCRHTDTLQVHGSYFYIQRLNQQNDQNQLRRTEFDFIPAAAFRPAVTPVIYLSAGSCTVNLSVNSVCWETSRSKSKVLSDVVFLFSTRIVYHRIVVNKPQSVYWNNISLKGFHKKPSMFIVTSCVTRPRTSKPSVRRYLCLWSDNLSNNQIIYLMLNQNQLFMWRCHGLCCGVSVDTQH